MSKVFVSCTIDLLQIIGKVMCFFQHVGAIEVYAFSHTNVNFNPNLEKFIHTFISYLEEIKVVLDRLYVEQNKALPEGHNFTVDAELRDSQTFTRVENSSGDLLAANTVIDSSKDTSDLLLTGDDLIRNNDQITNEQLISNHCNDQLSSTNDEGNALIPLLPVTCVLDSSGLVPSGSSYVDKAQGNALNNALIDSSAPPDLVTGGADLKSTILYNRLVQETSNHDDCVDGNEEEAILNDEEIEFRPSDMQQEIGDLSNNESKETDWNNVHQNKDVDDDSKEITEKYSYDCPQCGKVLSSKRSLLHHINIHEGLKPFCCEHCGKLFTTSTNLSAHLTRQHNLNTEFAHSCSECGKLFVRKSALNVHLDGHRGIKPFKCSVCHKGFTQKVTCDAHVLSHTRNYLFSCDVCSKRFATKSKLNFHKKKHGELQYSCRFCEKQFATRQYLTAHYESHNIAQTEAAPCCLDTVSENSRTQILEIAQVSCAQCNVTFKSQRALTRHTEAKHDPLAWYQCNVPNCTRPVKSFATKHQLKKHNQRHHSEQRRLFSCTTCGKEFAEKLSLAHHERQNHTVGLSQEQLKPYNCHLCSKRFTFKAKLALHIRTHTQDPQFRCEICAKSYYRSDSLVRHRRQHSETLPSSDMSSQQPKSVISCPIEHCTKVFKSRTALGFHLQTHNGNFKYSCETCGKRFVRKCHYDGHVQAHSDERPHVCDTCGRGFKDRKHWREHMKRVHTNEITMQSLFDSITSEDAALATQHNTNSYHMLQNALPPQAPPNCLTDVDVTGSYVLNQAASFSQFQSASSV